MDQCGFGIYLIHMIGVRAVMKWVGFNPYAHGPVFCIIAMVLLFFAVSYLITLALRSIPKLKPSSDDPKKKPDAKRYDEISIREVVQKNLGVVDGAAAAIALEQKMPMLVFKLDGKDSILRASKGEIDGTVVTV